MTTPADPTAALKLAQDKLHLIEIAAAGAAVTNSRDLDDWRGDMEDIRTHAAAALAAIDALPAPSGGPSEPTRADLIAALTFYANGGHMNLSDQSAWDTVSGEPQNWWCDEAGTATIEDGSLAKMALAGDMTAEHFAALERGDDVCIEAGAARAEPQAAPTPQTMRPAAHADNAPLGFTDHEKSAWSVGFEAGTTAQAAPAPQASGGQAEWREAVASLLSSGVGVETLRKLADGQGTDTDDGRAWLQAAALVAAPQAAPAPQAERVHELEQVLRAVQQEFHRVVREGNNFPDGFDSRLYRWVDDALAGTPQAAPAPQAEPAMQTWTPGSPSDPDICDERSAQACGPVYCGNSGGYCSKCPKLATPAIESQACKGMNCGAIDGRSHSLECQAEHSAAIAGGAFVPAPAVAAPVRALTEAQIVRALDLLDGFDGCIDNAKLVGDSRAFHRLSAMRATFSELLAGAGITATPAKG